jgi:hypothetical protein
MPPSPIQGYDSPGSPSETDSAADDSTSELSTGRQVSDKETPSPTSSRPGGSRIGPDASLLIPSQDSPFVLQESEHARVHNHGQGSYMGCM